MLAVGDGKQSGGGRVSFEDNAPVGDAGDPQRARPAGLELVREIAAPRADGIEGQISEEFAVVGEDVDRQDFGTRRCGQPSGPLDRVVRTVGAVDAHKNLPKERVAGLPGLRFVHQAPPLAVANRRAMCRHWTD